MIRPSLLAGHAPRIWLTAMAAVLLSGCSSTPAAPELATPAATSQWQMAVPAQVTLATAAPDTDVLAGWWQQWQDPVLNQLLEQVLRHNPDLNSSGISYRLALLQAGVATADYRPRGSVSTGISESATQDAQTTNVSAGVTASWELDLWGSRRAARERAGANVEKSLAELRAAQVSLIAEVVQVYVDLRLAQQNIRLAQEAILLRQQSYDLARWQRQAGLTTELQQMQALTLLRQTEATQPPYQQAELQALQQLQALAGGDISAWLDGLKQEQALPEFTPPSSLALPADVLRQRPDVRAQEEAVRAQTEAVVLARHQRYPSLALSGSITAGSNDAADLFDADAVVSRLAANLALVLFDGGVLKQAVRTQQLQLEQALLSYRSQLLTAQQEVESALTRLDSTQRQQQSFQQALESAELAAQLAALQHDAGLLSFTELLDAQSALLNARSSWLSNRSQVLGSWVQLYRSMGGGWQGLELPATAFNAAGESRE